MQKRLMLLGGIRYLLPIIETAHKLGAYVITADYLPDNIAHKYSDEYVNVSIIDKEAVLKAAQEKHINAISSFGVDPGVVSAAYVAEKMGLPFQCSYQAANILQDKSLFRQFLKEHHFNVPHAKSYCKDNIQEIYQDKDDFTWPIIVKPVDSAGSKGVSKVENIEQIDKAVQYAFSESHNGHIIIEDFLEKDGYSSGSESFFVNGKLMYNGFYDQYFDTKAVNPYTPSVEYWPAQKPESQLQEIRHELQRLGTLLKIKTGIFNVEWRLCKNGKLYLMEVSPRGGGNRLAEMLNYAADVDLIELEVRSMLGMPMIEVHEPNYKGYYAILVIHSDKSGVFKGVHIDDQVMRENVIEKEIRVNEGDYIEAFTGANKAIGTLFLKFSSLKDMYFHLDNQNQWMKLNIQ